MTKKTINEYRVVLKPHDTKDKPQSRYEGWYDFAVYKINDPETDKDKELWSIRVDEKFGEAFRKKFPDLSKHLSEWGYLNFSGEIWNKLENCLPLKSGRRTLSELIARDIKDFPNEPHKLSAMGYDKCPCSKHDCGNIDEYVQQGFHCEVCFADCVEIAE